MLSKASKKAGKGKSTKSKSNKSTKGGSKSFKSNRRGWNKKISYAVKRELARDEEVKCAPVLTIADQMPVNGTGLSQVANLGYTSTTSIVPAISQGVGDGQRIGNVINCKKLVVKYTLQALAVTAVGGTNNFLALPFLCRVIVYRHRYATDDYGNNNILDIGGSSQNLGSTPDLWIEPYNKKEYIIAYSKQYLMQPIANNTGASTVADNVANGAKQFVTAKAIIPMPKRLYFNDATTIPTNAGWFFAVACCNIDGTGATSTQFRARVNAESFLYYTDA